MDLTKIFVTKRDPREKEIEVLLEKVLEEWPKNGLVGKKYLKQAVDKKKNIERDKGQIYFEKYPEIPKRINSVIDELTEYES